MKTCNTMRTVVNVGSTAVIAAAALAAMFGAVTVHDVETFLAWDEEGADEVVALSMHPGEPGYEQDDDASKPATPQPAESSHPYPLETCIVSGEKLGSMGDVVVKEYDGREIRFCCSACVDKFEASQDEYFSKLDERIIELQLIHYPIDTCIVAGGKLGSMGDPVNLVYGNRLVRFCCAGCEPKFEADPEKYFALLDKKIIEQHRDQYPLTTCIVSGAELGSMGDPVEYTFNNRLVRFCCAGCIEKFGAEPGKYVSMLDKAYADAQREAYPLSTCVVSGAKLGSMGEPVERIYGNRLVRFCCKSCIASFEKDPARYIEKLDQK